MSTPGQFNPAPTPPPPKSGAGKVLIIILIIFGVLGLICAGSCGGCIFLGQRAAKNAIETVQLALVEQVAVVTTLGDERVRDKLGEPVTQSGGSPQRENKGKIDPVHESIRFEVSGSNGKATAVAHATKVNDLWKLTEIVVTFEDGEKITIVPSDDAPPQLNFDTGPETNSP